LVPRGIVGAKSMATKRLTPCFTAFVMLTGFLTIDLALSGHSTGLQDLVK
jgi:hypothetical protein